jgi:hypothetical protein
MENETNLQEIIKNMKCPICEGDDCIKKSAVELYLNMIKMFFKYQDKDSDITYRKYPTVGEIGECKKTFKRIWLCPYCKKPFESNYELGKVVVKCPNCDEILCIPVSNRTFC